MGFIKILFAILLVLPSFMISFQQTYALVSNPLAAEVNAIQTEQTVVNARTFHAEDENLNDSLLKANSRPMPDGRAAPTLKSTPEKETQTATVSPSEWIVPVTRSTPNANGQIIHVVGQGQSLWSIATAYGTKMNAILALNGLPLETKTLYAGQRLLIPASLTPYPTDTPAPSQSPTLAPDTATLVPTLTFLPPDYKPTLIVTEDLEAKAAEEERFRGGLFIALVISIILVVAGLIVGRR